MGFPMILVERKRSHYPSRISLYRDNDVGVLNLKNVRIAKTNEISASNLEKEIYAVQKIVRFWSNKLARKNVCFICET